VEITTDAYIDPLSITGNTLSALTVISDLGDVLIDGSGKEWVLTREQHPRLEGRIALFWHSGLA
jgi:phage terminase large subunit-like protein